MTTNISSIALNKFAPDLITSSSMPSTPPANIPGAVWWLVPPLSNFTTSLPAMGDISPLNINQYVWIPLTSEDIETNSNQSTTENQTTRLIFRPNRVLILNNSSNSSGTLPSVGNSVPNGWIYLIVPASSIVSLNVPSQFIFNNTSNETTRTGIVGNSVPIVNPNARPSQLESTNPEIIPDKIVWHIITPTNNQSLMVQNQNGQPVLRLNQLTNQNITMNQNTNQRTWWAQ